MPDLSVRPPATPTDRLTVNRSGGGLSRQGQAVNDSGVVMAGHASRTRCRDGSRDPEQAPARARWRRPDRPGPFSRIRPSRSSLIRRGVPSIGSAHKLCPRSSAQPQSQSRLISRYRALHQRSTVPQSHPPLSSPTSQATSYAWEPCEHPTCQFCGQQIRRKSVSGPPPTGRAAPMPAASMPSRLPSGRTTSRWIPHWLAGGLRAGDHRRADCPSGPQRRARGSQGGLPVTGAEQAYVDQQRMQLMQRDPRLFQPSASGRRPRWYAARIRSRYGAPKSASMARSVSR